MVIMQELRMNMGQSSFHNMFYGHLIPKIKTRNLFSLYGHRSLDQCEKRYLINNMVSINTDNSIT